MKWQLTEGVRQRGDSGGVGGKLQLRLSENVADNELSCHSMLLWLRKQSGNCHRTCTQTARDIKRGEGEWRGFELGRRTHMKRQLGSFVFGFGKLQKPRKN